MWKRYYRLRRRLGPCLNQRHRRGERVLQGPPVPMVAVDPLEDGSNVRRDAWAGRMAI